MSTENTHRTVTIAGQPVRVERVSARKASRAFALLRHVSKRIPDLTDRWTDYRREYRDKNVRLLSRPEARVRFPPQVVIDPVSGAPIREPDTIVVDVGGDSQEQPNPRAGELVTIPSAVDRMTEQDWQAAGDRYPLHEDPTLPELVLHVFDMALEVAEAHVYRLLALFTMSNEDVAAAHKDGSLEDTLAERADDLLDEAMADEVLELAVACGEVVDEQFRRKVDELGDRAGNALRLFGMGPTRTSGPPNGQQTSTPDSSTDGPSRSAPDGPPTSSSTPTTSSSSESESSQTTPEPELEPNAIGSE